MLNFGNKEFRNLQEQVLENAKNIETLKGREDLQIVIVNELPAVGNPNYIYLVAKNNGESPDVYDEYIWLENEQRYEKIGGVTIDLTNYVTTNTEQSITGLKTINSDDTLLKLFKRDNSYGFFIEHYTSNGEPGLNFRNSNMAVGQFSLRLQNNSAIVYSIKPVNSNNYDIGDSNLKWRDIYLSGIINHTSYNIKWDNGISFGNNSNTVLFYVGSNGQLWIYGDLIPSGTSGTKALGNNTHFFKDLYLTNSITDGTNTVSVANIASKATSTFISGTFDANGKSTIEQQGLSEGLYIFTYGNCQCFLRLTATMLQNADLTPIRVSCPMIFNNDAVFGWLEISRSGTTLTISIINDAHDHVDSGYSWTLTKTNLL